jgi:hypothetical protein
VRPTRPNVAVAVRGVNPLDAASRSGATARARRAPGRRNPHPHVTKSLQGLAPDTGDFYLPRMRALSRPLRCLRLLALIVQLAVPALATVADARLDLAGIDQPTHVESESHDCEPRGHGQDCALCQYARSIGLPERPAALLPVSDRVTRIEAAAPIRSALDRAAHPLPRGPPRFS